MCSVNECTMADTTIISFTLEYLNQCIGEIYFKYIFEEFQEPIISILRSLGKINYLNNLKYILFYFIFPSN